MAEYQMREFNLSDSKLRYPRMKIEGQCDLEALAKEIAYGTTFAPGEIVEIVKQLALHAAHKMGGGGYSVKIDDVGGFTPRLGLKKGAEPEETAEVGGHARQRHRP